MKPAPFAYERPRDVSAALAAMAGDDRVSEPAAARRSGPALSRPVEGRTRPPSARTAEGGEGGTPERVRATGFGVHPMRACPVGALAPYLDAFWRDRAVERGITQLGG